MRAGIVTYTTAEYVDSNDQSMDELPPPTRAETDASMISSWNPFLLQLNPLMQLGFTRPLQSTDLGTLPFDAQKNALMGVFQKALEEEKALPREKQSIWRVLYKTIGWKRVMMSVILGYCGSFCAFSGPLLLKSITNEMLGVQPLPGGQGEMWFLISLVFIIPIIGSVCNTQSNLCFTYMGVQVRNIMTCVIFDKITHQRATTLESGQITNLVNVDTKALEQIFPVLGTIFIVPGLLIVTLALIYREIGPSTLIGVAYCLVVMPFSSVLVSKIGAIFKERMQVGDKRLKKITEIFSGIRAIKYFAWEAPFVEQVESYRDAEQVLARRSARLFSVAFYLQQSIPAVLPVLIFSVYIHIGHELRAVQAFVVLQLVMLLIGPFNKLTTVGTTITMALGSSERVAKFLFRDDMNAYVHRGPILGTKDSDLSVETDQTPVVIRFENASLGWIPKPSDETSSPESLTVSEPQVASLPMKVVNSETKALKGEIAAIAFSQLSKEESAIDDKKLVTENSSPGEIELVSRGKGSEGSEVSESDVLLNENSIRDFNLESNKSAVTSGLNRGIYTLNNITFSVKAGSLIGIVGPIGCGKSSLLVSLLNELNLCEGLIAVNGTIAYHQQNSWIYNASLKANILFGNEFDQTRFDEVIEATSLMPDIKTLPNGLDTEIGEKGINLSGGQKARISMSRALYSNADILLLDDPLSAVDADVGNVMFYTGLLGARQTGKTILLATHQTQYLKDCDLVVVMEDGKISDMGSFQELLDRGIDTDSFSRQVPGSEPVTQASERSSQSGKGIGANGRRGAASRSGGGRGSGARTEVISTRDKKAESPPSNGTGASTGGKEIGPKAGRLMTTEHKAKGSIKLEVYWYYISRGHPFIYFLMFSVVLGSQALSTYSNIWLSKWGSATYGQHLSSSRSLFYLNYYTLFALMGSFAQFINMNLNLEHRTKAAKKIHQELLHQVIHAPVSFFDTSPLGRIMNIFSNDIRSVDIVVGMSMGQLLSCLGQICGNLGILAYTTQGTFLLVLIPLFLLYSYFQKYFQKSNLELKRLDSIANSPIVSQFTEILSGVASVRAFGADARYAVSMEKCVVKESTIFYLLQMVDSWKQLRLDFIGALMSLFVYVLAASTTDFLPPKLLLVAITYSNNLPALCSTLVTVVSNVESAFNSIERIMHYIRGITPEPQVYEALAPETNNVEVSNPSELVVDDNWPQCGCIEMKDVVVGYRDGPDVLKGVNASIRSTEKIGVVGRSGSGKSTLMVSLFRFENCRSGSIVVDGLDISKVPLKILRSRIGIIPQDPVLWSSTLRFNLDPLKLFTDSEIWIALDAVCMKDFVASLDNQLLFMVTEGGGNMSAGQRQLICFARTLLKKPKILVLDEATASVDNETDAIIQKMIRSQFVDCTVLTIAHRLNTVLDSDRLMVFDTGKVVELDSATNLLAQARLSEEAAKSTPTPGVESAQATASIFAKLYTQYTLFTDSATPTDDLNR